MPRARYPHEPRTCAYCGGHWTQTDGQPPRSYCTTTCRQAAEGRPAPSTPALPDPPLPISVRRVQARPVILTCAWCHTVVELEQFPGPLPRYCSPDCRREASRAGTATRMRRLRRRRLDGDGGPRAPKRDGPG
jgi:hypothetical protein